MTHNLLANYMAYDNPFIKSSTFYIPQGSRDIDEALKSRPNITMGELDARAKQLAEEQNKQKQFVNNIIRQGANLASLAQEDPGSQEAQNVVSGAVFALQQDVNTGNTIDNKRKFQSLADYFRGRGMDAVKAYSYAQASMELADKPGRWANTLDNALIQTQFDQGRNQENSIPVIDTPPTQQDISVGSGLNRTPEGIASSLAQIKGDQQTHFIPGDDMVYLDPSKYTPEVLNRNAPLSYPDSRSEFDIPKMTFNDFLNGTSGPFTQVNSPQGYSDSSLQNYLNGDNTSLSVPQKIINEIANRPVPAKNPFVEQDLSNIGKADTSFLNNPYTTRFNGTLNAISGDNVHGGPINEVDLSGIGNTDTGYLEDASNTLTGTGTDLTSPGANVAQGTQNASALQNILNSGKQQASNLWNNIKGNPVPWAIGGAAGLAGLAGLAKLTGMWPFDSDEEEQEEDYVE